MIEVIRSSEYKETKWSGGITREIFISPKEADYASRNFRFRVSTAKVLIPESDFTPLPGVERYLATLDGSLELTFEKEEVVFVNPDVVVNFMGDKRVHCVGTASDFNLMLKGSTGKIYRLFPNEVLEIGINSEYIVFAIDAGTLRFADEREILLEAGDSCHIKGTNLGCRWENCAREVLVAEVKREWRKKV